MCVALLFPGWGCREDTHPFLPFSLRVFPDDGAKTVQENLAGVLKRGCLEDVRNGKHREQEKFQ